MPLVAGGGEGSEAQVAGPPDEDESVEAALVAANKIYEVEGDCLLPIPQAWGQMPKIEILSSDKVTLDVIWYAFLCCLTLMWNVNRNKMLVLILLCNS